MRNTTNDKKKHGVDRWVIYDEAVGCLELKTEKTNISNTGM